MKDKKEKIDLLVEQNVAEQMSHVEWDKLNTAISSRLDKIRQDKTSAGKYPTVFKIAAAVAAAAAVVLFVVMLSTEKPADLQLKNGARAVVKFIDRKGAASVEIMQAGTVSQVKVHIGRPDIRIAKCDVEILDFNGDFKKDNERAAWIIISRPEPVYADNGLSSDMMSMIHLF